MRQTRFDWFSMGLVVAALALSIALYPSLPERMAIHWDLAGRPNGYGSRVVGAFVVPAVMFMLNVMLTVLPLAANATGGRAAPPRVMALLRAAVLLFLLLTHVFALLSAINVKPFDVQLVLPATGLLIAVLGNYMGKLQRNAWIGIRTPWTLADDEVWYRTHRLGGKLMVIGGLVAFVLGFVRDVPPYVPLAAILTSALVPAAYSYLVHRRVRKTGGHQAG